MKRPPSTNRPLWQFDVAGVLLCVALTAVTYFFGIRPVFEDQARRAGQRGQLDSQRAELTKLSNMHQQLRLRRVNVRRALAENALHLQPAARAIRRVTEISELASDCGLKVNQIQPGETRTGPRYGTKPIVLAGAGDFPTCVEFLRRLRKTFPDTGVVQFDLNNGGVGAKTPPMFTINLEWYTALGGKEPK